VLREEPPGFRRHRVPRNRVISRLHHNPLPGYINSDSPALRCLKN